MSFDKQFPRRQATLASALTPSSGARRIGVFGAAAVIALCLSGPVEAGDVPFELSDGRTVFLPMLADVDCGSADDVLSRIDAIGYRPIGPLEPEDPKDRVLYEYEERISDKVRECEGSDTMPFRFGIGSYKAN